MKTMIMAFLVVYCMSTPKEFKGTVMDFNNNEKLVGVMVVANKVDTTYTNLDGEFKLINSNGIQTLNFIYPSYENNNFILIKDSVDTLEIKPDKVLCLKK